MPSPHKVRASRASSRSPARSTASAVARGHTTMSLDEPIDEAALKTYLIAELERTDLQVTDAQPDIADYAISASPPRTWTSKNCATRQ